MNLPLAATAPRPRPPAGPVAKRALSGALTVEIDGREFSVQKAFLAMHSPTWAGTLAADPALPRTALDGDAESFRRFWLFMTGAEGAEGEVTQENVLDVLLWSKDWDIAFGSAACEAFLATSSQTLLGPERLLEIAVEHDFPLLYKRAMERVVHFPAYLNALVDEDSAVSMSEQIRGDVLSGHLAIGQMRGDGEMRRRFNFGDQGFLEDSAQRARLRWKSRQRFSKPPPKPPDHDWKKVQTVWPHHSFRGSDWTVVPAETQPTLPLRQSSIAAASGALLAKGGGSPRRKRAAR